MTQIQNRFDIKSSIADETFVIRKQLPNFFDNSDQMKVWQSLVLSILLHLAFGLTILLLALMGYTLPRFSLPDLPTQDIEFKLVQQESKPPINKKTKIRADRDSQAGGKHDPKKPISEPTPKSAAPAKPAVKQQAKPKAQPQPKPVVKQTPKVQPQAATPQPKPVQQQVKQVTKPQITKPTSIKAPSASLKPSTTPAPQGVTKPSAPKLTTTPKSPFTISTPAGAPSGTTYKPAGTPTGGGSSGGAKGTGVPAPKFSSAGGGTKTGTGGSSTSYAPRGTSGGRGAGTGGNPSPGNPNGTPGIDAIKQPNWGPYMRNLEQRIKRNWTPPKVDSSKRVVVEFVISRDGRLLSKRVTKPSGVPLQDRAAISAIEQTAPFSPLPPEFKGQSVTIDFTFDYNVLNSVMKK